MTAEKFDRRDVGRAEYPDAGRNRNLRPVRQRDRRRLGIEPVLEALL